jgi:small subunit ribosomal protein S3Ae
MQQTSKKKKKKWYPILSPKEFNNLEVGETLSLEPKDILNKMIEIDMGTLTRDIKRQNLSILLKIVDFKEEKFFTEVIGCSSSSSYLRKLTKSAKSKIELSFPVKIKDKTIRIKPVIVLKHKTVRSIKTSVSKRAQELIKEKLSTLTFHQLLDLIITLRLQKELQRELSKIYPVGIILIKTLKIE